MEVVVQPHGEGSLGELLRAALTGEMGVYQSLVAAVAFVKRSGVQYIDSQLRDFVRRGGSVRMVVGVDQRGTSVEGLSDLLAAVGDDGEVWVNHDEDRYVTFHPKLYLLEGETSALLVVGSGNLTLGGLYSNDEVSSITILDPTDGDDARVLAEIKAAVGAWCNEETGTALRLDRELIQALQEQGYVVREATSREEGRAEAGAADGATDTDAGTRGMTTVPLFERGPRRRVPQRPGRPSVSPAPGAVAPIGEREPRGFVMTLMRTDVGMGQTTPGTSRRSPEIFIPLTARDTHANFWGWSGEFTEDPTKPGKFDRRGVRMRLGGENIAVNMMTWPDKHDFRLRSEAVRSAGAEGDILRMEKADEGQDFVYYVEIIPPGTTSYDYYKALSTEPTPNSDKLWGYYDD